MEKDGKKYHILKSGKLIILPSVDSIDTKWYSGGNYKVIHKGMYNEWDPEIGTMIYPSNYTSINKVYELSERFTSGDLYRVSSIGGSGIVDEAFNQIVPMEYQNVSPIMFGYKTKISKFELYFLVQKNELWGVLNASKKLLIPCIYNKITPLTPTLYEINHNGSEFLIDDNNDLISTMNSKIRWKNGFDSSYLRCNIDGEFKYYSYDGKFLPNHRSVDSLLGIKFRKRDYITRRDTGKFAIKNAEGKVLTDYIYRNIEVLNDDFLEVNLKTPDKFAKGIFSIKEERLVVPADYISIEPFNYEKDFFVIKKAYQELELYNSSTGIISPSVKVASFERMGKRFIRYKDKDRNEGLWDLVLKKEVFAASKESRIIRAGNYIIRSDARKSYLYDSSFNDLKLSALKLHAWHEFILLTNESGNYGLKTLEGKTIIQPGTYNVYQEMDCNEGYLVLTRYDKSLLAVVNRQGKIINLEHRSIPSEEKCNTKTNYLRVRDDNTSKYGYVLRSNYKQILENFFDETYFISDNIRLVKVGLLWGVLDLSKNK